MQTGTTRWEIEYGVSQKSKANYPWLRNPTSGYLSKSESSFSERDLPTPVFTAASFTVAKRCKPKVQEWMGGNKTWSIHITERPSALNRKEFCHRLLPGWNLRDILSKISASHKKRQVLYDSIYMGYGERVKSTETWRVEWRCLAGARGEGERGARFIASFSLNWKSFEDQLYNPCEFTLHESTVWF